MLAAIGTHPLSWRSACVCFFAAHTPMCLWVCVCMIAGAAAGSMMDEKRCVGAGDVHAAACEWVNPPSTSARLQGNTTPSLHPRRMKFHTRPQSQHINSPQRRLLNQTTSLHQARLSLSRSPAFTDTLQTVVEHLFFHSEKHRSAD